MYVTDFTGFKVDIYFVRLVVLCCDGCFVVVMVVMVVALVCVCVCVLVGGSNVVVGIVLWLFS